MKVGVVGLQWGDEGKGKLIDILAPKFDIVVRFQGGPNAGHTVRRGEKKIIFHQLPSGVLHQKVNNLIGAGCVVNPVTLFEEIEVLKDFGIDPDGRLWISKFAHIILPHHILIDQLRESGKGKPIGTTKRGVGMCYEDKFARIGIRVADLIDQDHLSEKIKYLISYKNFLLIERYGSEPLDERKVLNECLDYGSRMKPMVVIDPHFLHPYNKKNILFESAQGSLLDINFGTYPFVTSSHPIIGGVGPSIGLLTDGITAIGVIKSYTTRVGLGPFPSELQDTLAERIRKSGQEYGATTGRPRRCGWLDTPALRYATLLNGARFVFLTKLDVLTGLKEIKIGIGYESGDGKYEKYDPSREDFKSIYKTLPGWTSDISGVTSYSDLPEEAKNYIDEIEKHVGIEVVGVSVGPKPEQTIWRKEII
ncbi:MAG TPA: adenylosuccinate synthase [bacterium (Candidatus Stahlbacteria)]|nr:adenylosuccinate synthase [Candidatus Stahlbacteria bacterium]